jgi:hypothetical protein
VTLDDIVTFFTGRMAGYRTPRQLICVDKVQRTPFRGQMKPDYDWARSVATDAATATT